MATALFTYKGLHFNPPKRFESAFGECAYMMALDIELLKRGEPWFWDGIAPELPQFAAGERQE